MNKSLFIISIILVFVGCNSYNKKMNRFLSEKKDIEIMLDTINQQDHRFRLITGYDEMDDSLALNTQYPHSELVDSIYYLKLERNFLEVRLKEISYSIDSLQKLK